MTTTANRRRPTREPDTTAAKGRARLTARGASKATANRASKGTTAERRIDPRLQARRSAVARAEGLRRLWIIGGLTMVASVAVLAIAIINSSWLDVDQVIVVGAERSDPEQILTAAGIAKGSALLELDLQAVTAAVEAVPWVAGATVNRGWGGEVTITVVERVGVVALPSGPRFTLVDESGLQVEVVDDRPDGFLPVSGLDETGVPGELVSNEGQMVVSLVDRLNPSLREVTEQIVVEDGRLMIDLVIDVRANLGDDRDLNEKLVTLETMLARVDLRCAEVIDVRVPSHPTVGPRSCNAEAETGAEG